MKCRNCGFEISEGMVFCSECGLKVEMEPQQPIQPLNAPQQPVQPLNAPQQPMQPLNAPQQPVQQMNTPQQTLQRPVQQPMMQRPVQPVQPMPVMQPMAMGPVINGTSDEEKVAGTGAFFGLMFVYGIPVIGWLVCILMSFIPKNKNIKHHARATLIWIIVGIVICIVMYFLFRQWIIYIQNMFDNMFYGMFSNSSSLYDALYGLDLSNFY